MKIAEISRRPGPRARCATRRPGASRACGGAQVRRGSGGARAASFRLVKVADGPELAGLRDLGARRQAAVRRRAGGHHPHRAPRQGGGHALRRPAQLRHRRAASRACSRSRSRPTSRRTASSTSTSRTRPATRPSGSCTRARAPRASGPVTASCWRSRTPSPTTTAGSCSSGPTGCSTSATATAAAAATGTARTATARTPASCSASCCASTSTTRSNGLPYGIPKDNPFAGQSGWRPEIWALGLRNPWRFSFDRANGDLWIGDVGQNEWEEVDHLKRGLGGINFGWNRYEGRHDFAERHAAGRREAAHARGRVQPLATAAASPAATSTAGPRSRA